MPWLAPVLAWLLAAAILPAGAQTAPRSHAEAAALDALHERARRGDLDAQLELAASLRAGRGVAADPRAAVAWYRHAAQQGHAQAQYELARMLLAGEGVMADELWAITWFRRAAEQGHAAAREQLAAIYHGAGLQAADHGNGRSAGARAAPSVPQGWQRLGALAVESGDHGGSTLPIDEDQMLALARAREHGIEIVNAPDGAPAAAPAASAGADAPVSGRVGAAPVQRAPGSGAGDAAAAARMRAAADAAFTRGDYPAARRAYATLAAAGDAHAAFRLGEIHERGLGTEPDQSWAITWYRDAVARGHAAAAARLEAIYAAAGLSAGSATGREGTGAAPLSDRR